MAPYGGLWHCFMLLNSLSSHHSESLRHVWAMGLRFRLLPFIHCSATMSAVMEHTHKNCLEISWFLRSRSSLSYLLSQAIFSVSNLPCITGNEIRWKHHPTCSCSCFWERVKQVLLIHWGRWLITPTRTEGKWLSRGRGFIQCEIRRVHCELPVWLKEPERLYS